MKNKSTPKHSLLHFDINELTEATFFSPTSLTRGAKLIYNVIIIYPGYDCPRLPRNSNPLSHI